MNKCLLTRVAGGSRPAENDLTISKLEQPSCIKTQEVRRKNAS
jgi:hypothetical protein